MNDIEQILKATIQAKVIEAFNTAPDVVEKLVQAALSKEVDEYGGKPDWNSERMPFMDWLVGQEIRNAVSDCVKEYVTGHKEEIAARVQAVMQTSDLAKPLADAVTTILSESYNWSVKLDISKQP